MTKFQSKFHALRVAAANLKNDRIREALDYAENNATETVYLDKSAPASELWELAMNSISMTAPYCEDAAVRRWFAKHGI